MKKRAPKRQARQKREDVVVPPSPYDFKETVRRLLKAKPPGKVAAPRVKGGR
jgi:hypothetical protein